MKQPLSTVIMSHLSDYHIDGKPHHLKFIRWLVFRNDNRSLAFKIDPDQKWDQFMKVDEGSYEGSGLPMFEEFVIAGFGPTRSMSRGMAGTTPTTGYSMQPISGTVDQVSSAAVDEACNYEGNDNPEHKGDSYIKEAKDYICNKIDESYNKKKTW